MYTAETAQKMAFNTDTQHQLHVTSASDSPDLEADVEKVGKERVETCAVGKESEDEDVKGESVGMLSGGEGSEEGEGSGAETRGDDEFGSDWDKEDLEMYVDKREDERYAGGTEIEECIATQAGTKRKTQTEEHIPVSPVTRIRNAGDKRKGKTSSVDDGKPSPSQYQRLARVALVRNTDSVIGAVDELRDEYGEDIVGQECSSPHKRNVIVETYVGAPSTFRDRRLLSEGYTSPLGAHACERREGQNYSEADISLRVTPLAFPSSNFHASPPRNPLLSPFNLHTPGQPSIGIVSQLKRRDREMDASSKGHPRRPKKQKKDIDKKQKDEQPNNEQSNSKQESKATADPNMDDHESRTALVDQLTAASTRRSAKKLPVSPNAGPSSNADVDKTNATTPSTMLVNYTFTPLTHPLPAKPPPVADRNHRGSNRCGIAPVSFGPLLAPASASATTVAPGTRKGLSATAPVFVPKTGAVALNITQPANIGATNKWVSGPQTEREQFERSRKQLVHMGLGRSPFIPTNVREFIEIKQHTLRAKTHQLQSQLATAIASPRVTVQCMGGKILSGGRSSVLAIETIWQRWDDKEMRAANTKWPERKEFKFVEGNREKSKFQRYLSLSRDKVTSMRG